MKIVHKTHGYAPDRTDPAWAERVEREAMRTTDQAEARWRKAQRRLEKAQARLDAALERHAAADRIARLRAEVADRLAEFQATERLMRMTPAGSQHRGKGSHRGVSRGEVL